MKFFRRIVVSLLILAAGRTGQAQVVKIDSTSHWKTSFKAGMNLNQSSFSSNWTTGGSSSFGFNALLNFKTNYKKGKVSWDNEIDLLYGMINNSGQGYRKTLDRIFIDTKYGHAISEKWDLSVSMNLQSQFANGYKYKKDSVGVEQPFLLSQSLAPTFITAALGFEYNPAPWYKVRFSPLAPRITLLQSNDGRYYTVDPVAPYGVKVGNDTRFEWAAFQMLMEINKDLASNINLKIRYVMFANYQTLEINKVDHRVDLSLTAKVTRFINVNIGGIMVYDQDQDNSPQYNQAFSLGFLYTFQNYQDK